MLLLAISTFPFHISSFPRFAKRIAGLPFFSREFFFPKLPREK